MLTRGDTSFHLIDGPPPWNWTSGSAFGNAVFAGAVLALFSDV